MMLVPLESMLMRILPVVGAEVAGNRTREIDDVTGSYDRQLRGGKAGLREE